MLIASWDARAVGECPILTFNDPKEEQLRAELFENWHLPKSRSTGGRSQERTTYRRMLTQPRGRMATFDDQALVALLEAGSDDAEVEIYQRFYPGLYRFLLGQGHVRQAIDAEDISAMTFIEVKKEVGKFEWKSKLGTWIYAVARNQATKFYAINRQYGTVYDYNNPNAVPYDETDTTREVHNVAQEDAHLDLDKTGEGRWQYAEDSDEEAQKNASGPRSLEPSFQRCTRRNPEQEYLSEERRGKVREYLAKMTKEEREIIKLRYFDGRRTSGKYQDGLTFKEIGRKMLKTEKALEVAHRRAIDELFVLMKFDPYFADRVIDPKPPSERKPEKQARQKAKVRQPEETGPILVT